jgi:hypothetical protein
MQDLVRFLVVDADGAARAVVVEILAAEGLHVLEAAPVLPAFPSSCVSGRESTCSTSFADRRRGRTS